MKFVAGSTSRIAVMSKPFALVWQRMLRDSYPTGSARLGEQESFDTAVNSRPQLWSFPDFLRQRSANTS